MIPSAFVPLAALPLTQNGKVDRKALPAPDTGRLRLDSAYAPPRTPSEKTLAAIWQDVLGHDRIGVNDNFFELGGSSLLLVEIEERLARRSTARSRSSRCSPPDHPEPCRSPGDPEPPAGYGGRGRGEADPGPRPGRGGGGRGGTLDRQRQAVEELRRRRASQQRSRGR